MRFVLVALAVAVAPLAAAQGHPQVREGFCIGFGFGYGSVSYSCSGCTSEGAVSGYLKLGGTLSPKLLVGGETNGWTKSQSGGTFTAANASAALYFYPAPTSGFFLRGGLGFASASASVSGNSFSQSGVGLVFGMGFDVRVGTKTSITPIANFNWGSLTGNQIFGEPVKQSMLQIAVGVTFH